MIRVKHFWIIIFMMAAITGNLVAAGQAYNKGNMYVSGNLYLKETFINETTASYLNNGNFYLTGNFINNQPAMQAGTPASSGTIVLLNDITQYITGTQPLNFYNLHLAKNASTQLVNMEVDVTVQYDLTLTKGIITTGANLFTYGNTGGTLTSPSGVAYADSYIATCNAAGVPLAQSSTIPFAGNVGFRINNVGATDTYFPVGVSYLMSEAGGTQSGAGPVLNYPTPNRMMINNKSGIPDNFTVVVNNGDLSQTPLPRVNRIWFVKSANGTGKADMRLFYTKRNWMDWPIIENETEFGYLWADPHLVQKNYAQNFVNNANGVDVSGADATVSAYNTEVFARYTVGVSMDTLNIKNGITSFSRFGIVNATGIILPVTLGTLTACQQGTGVKLLWKSLNENDLVQYTIERSVNATDFKNIGSLPVKRNGAQQNDYVFFDIQPLDNNNYYRITAIDKNGKKTNSNIALVNFRKNSGDIIVYPNPITEKFTAVQFSNMEAGNYELLLYNSNGVKVFQKTLTHAGGSATYPLTLPAGFASGVYYLHILSNHVQLKKVLLIE